MDPREPNDLHNGHVDMPIISVFSCTMHKGGWCMGTAQHDIIARKMMSFPSERHSMDELFNLPDLGFIIYKIVLVITSIAKNC